MLGRLAGPAATPALIEIMARIAARALAVAGTSPGGPGAAEPSEDARAEAAGLLQLPAPAAGPLEAAAAQGTLRAAGCLMDLILLSGPMTSRWPYLVNPLDAPLLDGLALLRAAAAGRRGDAPGRP